MTVIDAHHHLWPAEAIAHQAWRPADDDALRRAFEGDEFAELRSAAGVTASILMQSVDDSAENDRLVTYAAEDPAIAGVVAWAPLQHSRAAQAELQRVLEAAAAAPIEGRICGVRCLIGRQELDWLTQADSLEMFRAVANESLVWDVVPITASQRAHVTALSDAVPELRIVVDHLAAPPTDGTWEAWERSITELARSAQTALKLSIGVAVLEALPSWDPEFVRRAFATAIDAFGPERCMIASNWPVVELRAGYAKAWADQLAVLETLVSGQDLEQILGGTAMRWYGLGGVAR